MRKVFISYPRDAKLLAEELARAFERSGIQVWAGFKDIQVGRRWHDELIKAISDANWFVILARAESPTSGYQEAEWRLALESTWNDPQKRILPVVFGQGKVEPFQEWVPLQIADPAATPDWTHAVVGALLHPGSTIGEAVADRPWNIELNERPVGKL